MHPVELLSNVADNFIAEGRPVYGAPPGCNGPHADPETPYRNSAHWLVLLARLSLLTGSSKYRKLPVKLPTSLLRKAANSGMALCQ